MEDTKLLPGAVVELKSGGPLMVVEYVQQPGADCSGIELPLRLHCSWFNRNLAVWDSQSASFVPETLRVCEPASSPKTVQVGDTVILKASGPRMTVVAIGSRPLGLGVNDDVVVAICYWFNNNHDEWGMRKAKFGVAALEHITPAK